MRVVFVVVVAMVTALGGFALAHAQARVPSHIPVWAFDEYHGEGADAPQASVQKYLSFAEGGAGNEKAVRDCNGSHLCTSVMYFDPNFIYDSPNCPYSAETGFLAQAKEDWFVHLAGYTDAAHRVHGTYVQHCHGTTYTVNVWVANQANPAVRAYFVHYLQDYADDWQAYEMDDTSDTMRTQFYGPGGGFCKAEGGNGYCLQTQEIHSDAELLQLHREFAQGFKHVHGSRLTFYYNGINFLPTTPVIPPLLGNGSAFAGVICENCIVSNGQFRPRVYDKVLNAMAKVDRIPGASFVELNTGNSPSGSSEQIAQRLVTTAVAWIGFAQGHTIVWPNLEFGTHNLAAWPEDSLYPTEPLETMTDGPSDLAVAPQIYRRDFRACYDDGTPIGGCAAVLNASSAPVTFSQTWLRGTYGRIIVPSGGDVLAGGSLQSAPVHDGIVIPAGQALLLEH